MKRSQTLTVLCGAAGMACIAPAASATVVSNDTASFKLQMFGDLGTTLNINQGGAVSVARGNSAVAMGLNINGTSQIMGKWDELDNPNNPNTRLIVAELWTVGKDDLMPFGISKNDENFFFWTWNVGSNNAISFVNPTVKLFSAKVQMIRVEPNNAQTVLSNKSITDLPANWNGIDDGQTQTMVGQGMNLVRLTYEVENIPAPAGLALSGLAGLAACRRRRGV